MNALAQFIEMLPDWTILLAGFIILAEIFVIGHILLSKRDARAAVIWIGLVFLAPITGIVLYYIFGINRIRRRARKLRSDRMRLPSPGREGAEEIEEPPSPTVPMNAGHLKHLEAMVTGITRRELCEGNSFIPLSNGDNAFPAMLEAIAGARKFILLQSYIFKPDRIGLRFVEALAQACRRGVEVRVLVDGVGAGLKLNSILRHLQDEGIPSEGFLFSLLPWKMPYLNLRNHQKIMVIDGWIGFTGGMNISTDMVLSDGPRSPVRDIHFRVEGPVVRHMAEVFTDDWALTRGEYLDDILDQALPPAEYRHGTDKSRARGIAGGPDQEINHIRWTYLSAISQARSTIRIMTPYFLPDMVIISALRLAALRGVDVRVIMPGETDLKLVRWAGSPDLADLMTNGVRVGYTGRPFDHTKFMTVDGEWCLIGSPNWDARSLRLNFEFAVECYDSALCSTLDALAERRGKEAEWLSPSSLNQRSIPVRLRDGIARLLTPYL